MGAALLRPIFNADDRDGTRELAGAALERLRKPLPKVAALLEEAEADLLAFYSFPLMHWPKPRSTDENVKRSGGVQGSVFGGGLVDPVARRAGDGLLWLRFVGDRGFLSARGPRRPTAAR